MPLHIDDADAIHPGERIVTDQDRAGGAGQRIGEIIEAELPVLDFNFARHRGRRAGGGPVELHPHAAAPLRMQMLVHLLHFRRQRADVRRRPRGKIQILAGRGISGNRRRRVRRVAVHFAVDVKPVVFQLAADAADLNALLGENQRPRALP